jgi:membrane protease YdiL (CAAX protease family)
MEPYWSYEDIGIYFFVLVLLGAVIRIAVRIRWLDSSTLVTPSLALQTSVIVVLGLALYLILKWRHRRPVVVLLGWILPDRRYTAIGLISGVVAAISVALVTHFRHETMPSTSTVDFLVLGFVLGPILEESVFRGCLLPVLARTLGSTASVVATAVLFSAFHGPRDLTHWVWFGATGVAYGWLRLASHSTTAAALMHAACNLTLFLAAKF